MSTKHKNTICVFIIAGYEIKTKGLTQNYSVLNIKKHENEINLLLLLLTSF